MKFKRSLAFAVALAMVVSTIGAFGMLNTFAADSDKPDPKGTYAMIGGAGTRDGSSWANAMDASRTGGIQAAWDATPEDGTLYLAGGDYGLQRLTIRTTNDGKGIDALKKLVGVDRGTGKPILEANFTNDSQGNDNFIRLEKGASFVSIDNIKLLNYAFGIRTAGDNEGLRFYNIDFENMSDGFYIDGAGQPSSVRDLIIDGCTGKNFKKSLVRLRNGVSDVIISNCFADAGGKEFWVADNFPMAFQMSGATERITYVDNVAQSSYHEAGETGYWNSDGFNSERDSKDITYIRCRAYDSTDGGWDVKASNPTLIDCISIGNKRNYRLWSNSQATLINCLGAYAKTKGGIGIDCGIMACGGKKDTTETEGNGRLVVYNSTFYNNAGTQVLAEGATLTFYNCIIGTDDPANKIYYSHEGYENNGYKTYNTVEYIKGVTEADKDPQFKAISNEWFDGKSDKWNSLKYKGSVGYHYDPDKAPATYDPNPTAYGMIADMTSVYDWAKEAVEFMVKNDYLPGRSNVSVGTSTVFGPSYNLTRAEFAVMLVRTLGLKTDKPDSFGDVPEDFVYAADIGIAKAVGVVKGNDKGEFMPMADISRQDVMVMLSRALKIAGKLPNDYNAALSAIDSFSDKGIIYDYAKQDVANMVEKEIIKGGTDGTINPLGNTTRAEGAVIGKRVFDMK